MDQRDQPYREGPSLTAREIQTEVIKRIKRYDGLNFLEQFAMFMGIAQVVEMSLKQLLHRRYGIGFESLERRTLGQVAHVLRERGLRPDFHKLLKSVTDRRNHIAHSLLANQFMLAALGAGEAPIELRELEKGIYELEQLWFLYEWTEQHNAWSEDAT